MKKTLIFITALALTALTLVTSCQKEQGLFRFTAGTPVSFGVTTSGSALTRTSYSDVESNNKERIDWEVNDRIRIYCEAVSEPSCKYADYRVLENSVRTDGNESSYAKIIQSSFDDMGLRWGDGTAEHVFYSVYPSPMTSGKNSDEFPGKNIKTTVKLHVPAEQSPVSVDAAKNDGDKPDFTAVPDLTSEYMVARRTIDAGTQEIDGNTVFLSFKPIVTAIEFTIENGFAEGGELKISSISLTSKEHSIAGAFTVKMDDLEDGGTKYPLCTSVEDDKTVTIPFSEPVTLARGDDLSKPGQSLKLTFFLKPSYNTVGETSKAIDIDDLTFRITKSDGSWIQTRLGYTDGSGVVFPCHKKTFVEGLLVPEGAQWTVKYGPTVEPWSQADIGIEPSPEVGGGDIQLVTPWNSNEDIPLEVGKYNYSLTIEEADAFSYEGGTKSMTVISSRSNPDNTSVAGTPWHIEYMDGGEWVKAVAGGKAGGFVTFATVSGSGSTAPTGETVSITADASEKKSLSHNDRLQSATARGTEAAPYDLSMYDIYGVARTAPVTANSYVIDAPGWYAFPLVYGNAIDAVKAASFNVMAYNPGGSAEDTNTFLSRFKNSKGSGITSPYIESDLGAASLVGWTAYPLWQDVTNAIVTDDANNCKVIDKSAAAGLGLKLGGKCGYVLFHVNQVGLTQGNVLIAVNDGTNIVWSWHIWVTDEDLTPLTVTNSGGTFEGGMLPINLGWVDNDVTTQQDYYNPRSLKCRIVQDISDYAMEFTIEQQGQSSSTVAQGSSPYYQWGRKDPFIRNNATCLTHGSVTVLSTESVGKPVSESIKSPTVYYTTNAAGMWCEGSYVNLWSSKNTSTGTSSTEGYSSAPTKSVYDPCPPGFHVPQTNAFSNFSKDNSSSFSNGYYFYTKPNKAGELIFFPALGYRLSNDGSVSQTFASCGNYNYWSAVPSSSNAGHGCSMNFSSESVDISDAWLANGLSVRPVAE